MSDNQPVAFYLVSLFVICDILLTIEEATSVSLLCFIRIFPFTFCVLYFIDCSINV